MTFEAKRIYHKRAKFEHEIGFFYFVKGVLKTESNPVIQFKIIREEHKRLADLIKRRKMC